MRDPNPENITGQKVQRHTFKHEINWGQVALALAVICAVWVVATNFGITDSDDESENVSGGL